MVKSKKSIVKKALKDVEKGETKLHEKVEKVAEKKVEGDILGKYKNLKK